MKKIYSRSKSFPVFSHHLSIMSKCSGNHAWAALIRPNTEVAFWVSPVASEVEDTLSMRKGLKTSFSKDQLAQGRRRQNNSIARVASGISLDQSAPGAVMLDKFGTPGNSNIR